MRTIKAETRWHKSLQFNLLIVFCSCLILAVIAVIFTVQQNTGDRIFAHSRAYTIEKGQSVVNRVGQQIVHIESIAKSIARVAETSPNNPELIHQLIPNILENKLPGSIIAGGGIWPEPFSFDATKPRNSFFWGAMLRARLT